MASGEVTFRIQATDGVSGVLAADAAAARDAAAAEKLLATATDQATAAKRAQAAVNTPAHLSATGRAANTAAAGMGAAAHQAQSLQFQLFDIGQGLVSGVNPLVILAQQGPQVAQSFMGAAKATDVLKAALAPLGAALAVVAPVLVAIAPAAIAAGAAYLYFSNELENAEAKAAKFAATAQRMQEAHAGIESAMGDTADRIKVLSGEYTSEELAAERRIEALKEATRATIATMEADGASAEAIRAVSDQEAVRIGQITQVVELLDEKERREKAATAAAKSAAAADRAAAKAALERAAAEKSRESYDRTHLEVTQKLLALEGQLFDAEVFPHLPVSEFERLGNAIAEMFPAQVLTDAEKLAGYLDEIALLYATGELSPEQAASLQASATAAGLPSMSAAAIATTAAGAVSDPLSAVASINPIAAAIVAGVQAAATGGSVITEAADTVLLAVQSIDEVVERAIDAAIMLITEVPGALIESLPDLLRAVAEGIPRLIGAVAQAIPNMLIALVEAIPAMLPDLVLAFIEAILIATPAVVVALTAAIVDVFTDPETYRAIADAFVHGIERMFERLGELLAPVGEAAGDAGDWLAQAGRDVSTALDPGAAKSTAGRHTTLRLDGRDFLSDFVKSIDIESGPSGRIF